MDDADLMREILETLISDTSRQLRALERAVGDCRCQRDGAPGPLFQRRVRQCRRHLHGAHPAGDREEGGGGRPAGLRSIARLAAARVSEAAGGGRAANRLNSSAALSLRRRKARLRAWIRAAVRPRPPRYRRRAKPAASAARFARHPLGERRSRRDRSRAPARTVARLGHPIRFEPRGQPQNIAAGRIAHLHRNSRRLQIAHIAGISKMFQQKFRVHSALKSFYSCARSH